MTSWAGTFTAYSLAFGAMSVSAAVIADANYSAIGAGPHGPPGTAVLQLLAKGLKESTKTSIEKAIVNEKTKNDPELWGMRALLYSEMAFTDSTAASAASIKEAQTSLAKAKELDPQADTREYVKKAKQILYQKQLVIGKKLFDQKDFTAAYTEFNNGLEYMPGDTVLNYYAGASGLNGKNYPGSIKNYTALLSTNFSFLPDVYKDLAEAHLANKDTAAAFKLLTEGQLKYPKSSLIARQLEVEMGTGKYKEALPRLEEQAKANPDNKNYQYYLGVAYSNLNQSAKAEEAYKKAIALDPTFIEPYINIGGLIMNLGIDIINKAAKQYGGKSLTPAQLAQYKVQKKNAEAEYDRALPYLTKAVELDPKSGLALNNLKAYYQAKSNPNKVAEINAKIKALK